MKETKTFYKKALGIAVPVTLQSLLQSSFSVVDQIMTGQLGSTNIAGIGLAGKFASIFSVLVSAIATAAGIMIAQYIGKKDEERTSRSFVGNLFVGILLALLFLGLCLLIPAQIMGIYTSDGEVRMTAEGYLRIVSFSFLPMAGSVMLSTLLRCMEAASFPLYAGMAAALVNTLLNYLLIFGKFDFPKMGANGAALATVISQIIGFLILYFFYRYRYRKQMARSSFTFGQMKAEIRQYLKILLPILACEFLWSLGENVYAVIYGHIGTTACAAMTLTAPIQMLFIGALSGLSQAAGILIGKTLGKGVYEEAYQDSKKLMKAGVVGSLILSVILILTSGLYVRIFPVADDVRAITRQILFAFALVAPLKVENMILGGGIIRSGGKTEYVMWIDMIGTWLFGVPLGFLTAFVLHLDIPFVYFILSLEEGVRLLISLFIFRKRKWMERL